MNGNTQISQEEVTAADLEAEFANDPEVLNCLLTEEDGQWGYKAAIPVSSTPNLRRSGGHSHSEEVQANVAGGGYNTSHSWS